MNGTPQRLFFLAGLWFSLFAFGLGGMLLLPKLHISVNGQGALLFALADNDARNAPPSVPLSGKAVLADLNAMRLSMYEDGVLSDSVPIISRGREGTFWETPRGIYAIRTKEAKHFSSLGNVWMPYSMQFYGNFYVHGWPVKEDGTPVPRGYSGGCIRLATDDARTLYRFAEIGMPFVVVSAKAPESFATSSAYYVDTDGVPPEISAKAFLAADADTGEVLWERDSDTELPPGNMSALLSALVAVETVNQYKHVRMSELLLGKTVLRGKASGLEDEIPLGAFIYPLVYGGNDTAAKTFAKEHGMREFVRSMNEKARAIGMEHSSWSGPLSDDKATTTATDLFRLISYARANKRFVVDVSLSSRHEIVSTKGDSTYTWANKNPWVVSGDGRYRGGIASVDPDGGGDAVVLFALPLSEFDSRTIAVVLLGSNDLTSDVESLTRYIEEWYVYGIESSVGNEGAAAVVVGDDEGIIETLRNIIVAPDPVPLPTRSVEAGNTDVS
jgi:hypothetical protein